MGRIVARGPFVNPSRFMTLLGTAIALALALALACGCAGRRPAASGNETAVVLTEVHSTAGAAPETLVTWIADGRVRVAHRGGIAILDARTDRFALLDPESHTVRTMRLAEWEQKLRVAVQSAADTTAADSARVMPPGTAAPEPVLRFETEGPGGEILGHACTRYHVYTTRQLFPGEWEDVEQEIWVAGDVNLSPSAANTYGRVLVNLDWIGLDAAVERPPGVALRTQIRRRPHAASPPVPGAAPPGEELETTDVIRIETRPVPASVFEIPSGYRPADDASGRR